MQKKCCFFIWKSETDSERELLSTDLTPRMPAAVGAGQAGEPGAGSSFRVSHVSGRGPGILVITAALGCGSAGS